MEIGSSVLRSPFVLGGSDNFQGNHTRGYEGITLMDMVLRTYLKTNKCIWTHMHCFAEHLDLLTRWSLAPHSSFIYDTTKFVFHAIHSNNIHICCFKAFEWVAPQNRKFSQVDLCSNKHLSSVFQIH